MVLPGCFGTEPCVFYWGCDDLVKNKGAGAVRSFRERRYLQTKLYGLGRDN